MRTKKIVFFLSCTMRIFNCDSYIVYLYTHFGCDSLAIQNLQKPMGLDMTFLLPQNIINILQLYCALNTINSARAFNNNSNNIKQFAFAHSIYARQLKITAMFMENEKKNHAKSYCYTCSNAIGFFVRSFVAQLHERHL